MVAVYTAVKFIYLRQSAMELLLFVQNSKITPAVILDFIFF